MKVITLHCDVCGGKDVKISYYPADPRTVPANTTDDVTEALDLCRDCSWIAHALSKKRYAKIFQILRERAEKKEAA
jgi:hypothetical protein